MGVVEEAGKAVTKVKRGDRVVIPFTISCGQCFFCAVICFRPAKPRTPGAVPSSTKSKRDQVLHSFVRIIFTAASRADKPNWSGYPWLTSGHS